MLRTLSSALAALALAGCASRPPIPVETTGSFVIEEDLVGRSTARGEFRAITGARRGFSAELFGEWDGRVFTLIEDFVYDDGERDRKTWRLTRTAPGRYVGTREDVVGQAIGFQDGPAFRLEYEVRLPSKNGPGRKVRFRDVLVETGEGVVLNRAHVSWLGIGVARVDLTMRRTAADQAPASTTRQLTSVNAP